MSKRRHYDDKFRASAVVTLEAAGYPEQKGALDRVASHLGVPAPTLHRWANGKNNPPPSELVNEKRQELSIELREVAYVLVKAIPGKVDEASLQQVTTSLGIVIDKMQLLECKPTWIGEIAGLLKEGKITPQEVMDELSDTPELAQELFESVGLQFVGIGEAEA
jgi:transposase-like protein